VKLLSIVLHFLKLKSIAVNLPKNNTYWCKIGKIYRFTKKFSKLANFHTFVHIKMLNFTGNLYIFLKCTAVNSKNNLQILHFSVKVTIKLRTQIITLADISQISDSSEARLSKMSYNIAYTEFCGST
jgi:hypothetical protein